jgi:hypothetical protein
MTLKKGAWLTGLAPNAKLWLLFGPDPLPRIGPFLAPASGVCAAALPARGLDSHHLEHAGSASSPSDMLLRSNQETSANQYCFQLTHRSERRLPKRLNVS